MYGGFLTKSNADMINPIDYISEDFLQVLEEHRKVCEKEGKLNEAAQAKKRLRELRKLEDIRKKELLISKHKCEMKALENAHKVEIKELINKWNNLIIPNFENECSLLEIELKTKHQNEFFQFREQMSKDQDSLKFHYSSEILNLTKRSEILGQQGLYQEAKKLKKKLKKQILVEKEKHELTNKGKTLNKQQLMIIKHQREMQSLKKKHQAQRENLEIQKKKEFEIIEKRFINVWNDLETKYKKELLKLEKQSPIQKMKLREGVHSNKNRSFIL